MEPFFEPAPVISVLPSCNGNITSYSEHVPVTTWCFSTNILLFLMERGVHWQIISVQSVIVL